MTILSKLSVKNLKLNKKRTISTIIGIILSVSLICAVATMFTSFQETLIENSVNENGYWHLSISKVSDDDLKELKNNREIKDLYTINRIGYSILENSGNNFKPYLKLLSTDKKSFEQLKFNLKEGSFPQNNHEILISSHIITNAGVEYKVGDTIKLNVGRRMSLDGYELYPSNLYNEEEGYEEEIVDPKQMEFKVVGIIDRPSNDIEPYSDPGYTVITTDLNGNDRSVYISLKNPENNEKVIPLILGVKNYDETKSLFEQDKKFNDYDINNELLRWEVFAFSDSTVTMLVAVVSIVIFIILFTSVFCIRNSFAIATTEKTKMYGMLASVGATKKQIKKNVIFEALLLGVVGIPLGILGGIFAVYVVIAIVNAIIGDMLLANVDGIIVKVTLLPIILSVILGYITIYLSAISSARRASKVSPIESLRNSQDIKITSKKLKSPKIISKVFKTGGVLAYKNLKRSKKKYRTTVVSLAVSIFVFISMNSFIDGMFGFTSRYYQDYDYNVHVYRTSNNDQTSVNKIIELENIENYCISYIPQGYGALINDKDKIVTNEYTNSEFGLETESVIPNIILLEDKDYREYLKKARIKYDETKSSGVLIDECTVYDGKEKSFRRYSYEAGDVINCTLEEKDYSIKISGITKARPRGMERTYQSDGFIILNKDYYGDIMKARPDNIVIQSDNPDKLVENIKNLKLDIYVSNLEEQVREEKSMSIVIGIFLYGFIAVISLIGVTNIFNTITSNMELRQREFATLKSVGMTKKEFNRMINLETIFYSTKALLYGIILGFLGTLAIDKAFDIKVENGIHIPYIPILISILFVFIIVYIIMKFSMSKINKQNIIETIRKENI